MYIKKPNRKNMHFLDSKKYLLQPYVLPEKKKDTAKFTRNIKKGIFVFALLM